jgi:NAD(P)-dependent dehydrogenase (short-subunit alcohol dehydrogenase family)
VRRSIRVQHLIHPEQTIDGRGKPHSPGNWDLHLAVNLTGTFNLTRLALEHLVRVPPEDGDGERGVIILVSSTAAVLPVHRLGPRSAC